MVLESGDDIVAIDAGVLFPDERMPGVDFVVPDVSYLAERADRVCAVLITHGHEDHTGALPYVLPEIRAPIYASRLTHGLIDSKLGEHGLSSTSDLRVAEPGEQYAVGNMEVEFFRMSHSIPDAMGIAIRTEQGVVVHTGDFKIDHTPPSGHMTDLARIAQIAEEGVKVLCSDSTYAEVEGYTPSEEVVRGALNEAVTAAPGRVIVATFASLISRIQMVIDCAVASGRSVTVIGRSMRNNVTMALRMGYLDAPDGVLISPREARRLSPNRQIVLATGAQGEPTSALVRMSRGEHRDVEIDSGDTVIISSSPIPGNETLVARTIDDLYRRGAEVISSRNAAVHVHGHASREELKLMLNLVKPDHFVPVHGERRHLVAHAKLAQSLGMDSADTFVLENGDVLEMGAHWAGIVDRVPVRDMFVAGHRLWGGHTGVLAERGRLSEGGVVTISVVLDAETGALMGSPTLRSSGFEEAGRADELFENASQVVQTLLETGSGKVLDFEWLESEIKASVSDFLYRETRRRPTILAIVEAV